MSLSGQAAIAALIVCTVARVGGNCAVRGHFPDAVSYRVGDIEISGGVECQPERVLQGCLGGGTAIACDDVNAVARERMDDAIGW